LLKTPKIPENYGDFNSKIQKIPKNSQKLLTLLKILENSKEISRKFLEDFKIFEISIKILILFLKFRKYYKIFLKNS
jgi:hypothetical protein